LVSAFADGEDGTVAGALAGIWSLPIEDWDRRTGDDRRERRRQSGQVEGKVEPCDASPPTYTMRRRWTLRRPGRKVPGGM